MEDNKLEIVKPEFSGEIQAHIKSVGEIESNMKEVRLYVEDLNNYYKNVMFTEDTMKQAKDEKSNVNKFKKQVADYRKNIVEEYNKPIKAFEDTAKETEKLLADTYNTINKQVANYEEKQKQEKEKEIRQYFEEYRIANNIDFITYERTGIKVTLSASMKNLMDQAKNFIDKVTDDLRLIEAQQHKEEILVEYKQTLNVSHAITTVVNRFEAIEEEKRKQEDFKRKQIEQQNVAHIETNTNHEITKESYEQLEAIFNKPLEQPKLQEKQEEILILKLTVKSTETKLKALKQYLENGGYDYE